MNQPGGDDQVTRLALAAGTGDDRALDEFIRATRRDVDDLIARTPADGLVAGTARVNGTPCAVLSYDYTVLAGTQGALGHLKKDRLFELIERMRLPTVFFAEGGGGRPGDTDYPTVSSLDVRAFALWAKLSGVVPRIAVVKGRCFAGNAVIAGCSDLIVATADTSIGMGGPAMIAGGGLGDVAPDDVGPISVQEPNGVVDVVVADEAEAVAVAKKLLGYFQGSTAPGRGPDQTCLRTMIPERARRAYPVRPVIETLADTDSVTFLRERFAPEMVTALARIDGRPVGMIANNTMVMPNRMNDHDAALFMCTAMSTAARAAIGSGVVINSNLARAIPARSRAAVEPPSPTSARVPPRRSDSTVTRSCSMTTNGVPRARSSA